MSASVYAQAAADGVGVRTTHRAPWRECLLLALDVAHEPEMLGAQLVGLPVPELGANLLEARDQLVQAPHVVAQCNVSRARPFVASQLIAKVPFTVE
jgi:hypothetical protein